MSRDHLRTGERAQRDSLPCPQFLPSPSVHDQPCQAKDGIKHRDCTHSNMPVSSSRWGCYVFAALRNWQLPPFKKWANQGPRWHADKDRVGLLSFGALQARIKAPRPSPSSPGPLCPREPRCLTTTLGDVADPGQGLVTAFLDDLHVSDLEGNERR